MREADVEHASRARRVAFVPGNCLTIQNRRSMFK